MKTEFLGAGRGVFARKPPTDPWGCTELTDSQIVRMDPPPEEAEVHRTACR